MSRVYFDWHSLGRPADPNMKAGDAASVKWCSGMFANLANNGKWAIPRSGLVFQRNGEHSLNLESVAEGFAHSEQVGDFNATQAHMKAAGVTVTDTRRLLDGGAEE